MNIVHFRQQTRKLWCALILLCLLTANSGPVARADAMTTQAETNAIPQIMEGDRISTQMSVNGNPQPFALSLHATDADNDSLTWQISIPAQNGATSVSGTGTTVDVKYIPTWNFSGTDGFVVTVSDEQGATDSIVVDVTIAPVPEDQAPAIIPTPEEPRIVGGGPADPGEYPWQVALVFGTTSDLFNGQFCGGSLIAPKWVLTAAHCITDGVGGVRPPSYLDAVAGIYDLASPAAGYQRRDVIQIIRHPSYNPSTFDNDLALLRLASPITIGGSGATKTAAIPLVPANIGALTGVNSWVTGWGNTAASGTPQWPTALQEVQIPIIANSVCNDPIHYNGAITGNMMCAGFDAGGKDSCQGDSGGPLIVPSSGQWVLAGIVSWGNGCAQPNKPGVYTRVSQYVDWINNIIGPRFVGSPGYSVGTCGSWLNGCNLQYALSIAQAGDEIWVRAGTYKPAASDRSVSFHLKNGVAIYGGFAGTETSLSQRDPAAHVTILSGDIGTIGNSSDNSYHVVSGGSTDNTAILDGFTIQDGRADGVNWPDYNGGGMINYQGTPTLSNLTFQSNHALNQGGGMMNDASSGGSISNSVFLNNHADAGGGGVENWNSSVTVTNVTFWNNFTFNQGGGLRSDGGSTVLQNVTFFHNLANNGGGGLLINSSTVIAKNTIIAGSTTGDNDVTDCDGGSLNASSINNLIRFGSCELMDGMNGNIVGTYPNLGALANNGGFTQTMALLPGSPAIDTGDDSNCSKTDQRGAKRPRGRHCDIGAYEVQQSFVDVPTSYWAWDHIERLYGAGITSGCSASPLMYCPSTTVTRDQMAVFLLRGEHGSSYVPPTATGVFQDVPTNYWAAAWIEQLATEGITAGCGSGTYCPTTPVTRDQMAVFLLKAKHGSGYVPPAPTGMFSDVPTNYWAASWIEQLAVEGVTAGCGGGNYCPTTPVTRDQMAVFLVKNFNLP